MLYREAHMLLEELADATALGTRKPLLERLEAVPLLFIDDLEMLKLPATAAEDLLELVMRRHERASTLLTPAGCRTREQGATLARPRRQTEWSSG